MTPEQEALRDRVTGGKSPIEWLHDQAVNNPRSPSYVPKRRNAHPERDLQNAILQWLTLKRICHVRLNVAVSTV